MAKTVKFKNPNSAINIGGQVIAPHNITMEVYDYLVKIAPTHAELFDIEEEKEVKAKEPKEK